MEAEKLALAALRGTFRPEFLNRTDDIIVFKRIDAERICDSLDIQISAPLLAQREMELELSDAAKPFRTQMSEADAC